MDFISNQFSQIKQMLQDLGIRQVQDLFESIPPSILEPAPIEDDGLSEYEGFKMMEAIAAKK